MNNTMTDMLKHKVNERNGNIVVIKITGTLHKCLKQIYRRIER